MKQKYTLPTASALGTPRSLPLLSCYRIFTAVLTFCHVTRVQQHETRFSASSKALCLIKTLITGQQMTKRFQIH